MVSKILILVVAIAVVSMAIRSASTAPADCSAHAKQEEMEFMKMLGMGTNRGTVRSAQDKLTEIQAVMGLLSGKPATGKAGWFRDFSSASYINFCRTPIMMEFIKTGVSYGRAFPSKTIRPGFCPGIYMPSIFSPLQL